MIRRFLYPHNLINRPEMMLVDILPWPNHREEMYVKAIAINRLADFCSGILACNWFHLFLGTYQYNWPGPAGIDQHMPFLRTDIDSCILEWMKLQSDLLIVLHPIRKRSIDRLELQSDSQNHNNQSHCSAIEYPCWNRYLPIYRLP